MKIPKNTENLISLLILGFKRLPYHIKCVTLKGEYEFVINSFDKLEAREVPDLKAELLLVANRATDC